MGVNLRFKGLEIWCSKVYGISNYETVLKIRKFKIVDPIWLTKIQSYLIQMKFGFFGSLITLTFDPKHPYISNIYANRINFSFLHTFFHEKDNCSQFIYLYNKIHKQLTTDICYKTLLGPPLK